MTISTTASRISYNGNGVTVAFSFPYRFLANRDIVVVLRSSTGAESILLLDTHYTLSGAGADAGGTVTMAVAPAVGERLVIYRSVAITQETDYISGDPFPAETHERALDRAAMIDQQQQDSIDRTLRFPVSDTVSPELPTQAVRANKLLAFDALGNPTTAVPMTDSSTDVRLDLAADDGSTMIGANAYQTQAEVNAESVSVLAFGADPTGVEDSTTAIQAAIDSAQTRPVIASTTVYIPAGTYKITSSLVISKDVRIVGDGGDVSIINLAVSSAQPAFDIEPAVAGYIWLLGIHGVRINCKAGAVAGDGISIASTSPSAVSQCSFSDLQIRDFRDGIVLTGTSGNEIYINEFHNIKLVGASLSGAGVNDVRYGLKVTTAVYNTFRNIEVTNIGNAGYAVYCEGAGSHFEQITTDGVSYIDSPFGVIDHWTVETVQATTPVSNTCLNIVRLLSARNLTLIEVDNAKCEYGINVNSAGTLVDTIRVEQSGGDRPNYPVSFGSGSSGVLVNWKGSGAFKVEVYTPAAEMQAWRFIGCSDITDRTEGVALATAGAKPTASEKLRGQLCLEKGGAGVADVVYVCRKTSADAYEWQALA